MKSYLRGRNGTVNHFKQLKAVLKELNLPWSEDIVHIHSDCITLNGKKLSTRKKNHPSWRRVKKATELLWNKSKRKTHHSKTKKQCFCWGKSAVIFDLKNDRTNNFDFALEEVVQFEGETGPRSIYTLVRWVFYVKPTIPLIRAAFLTDDDAWSIETHRKLSRNIAFRWRKNADHQQLRNTDYKLAFKRSINITHTQSTRWSNSHPLVQTTASIHKTSSASWRSCSDEMWSLTSSRISRILNAHIEAMNKRSSGCPREKRRELVGCKTIPHIREVHLGAIRQDVSSDKGVLSGWCLASSTRVVTRWIVPSHGY